MNRSNWKQKSRRLATATLLLALVILVACGDSAAADLVGTDWQLAALEGNDPIPGTTITLSFSEETLSGSAGCNHYEASYKISGDSLGLSDLFWTEMGCMEPDGILEQETDYLLTLNASETFQLAGDQLELLDANGEPVLVFMPTPSGTSP